MLLMKLLTGGLKVVNPVVHECRPRDYFVEKVIPHDSSFGIIVFSWETLGLSHSLVLGL